MSVLVESKRPPALSWLHMHVYVCVYAGLIQTQTPVYKASSSAVIAAYACVCMLREAEQLFLVDQMIDRNFVRYKKTVIPKKKYISTRDLKDCLPNLPLKTGKATRKIAVFLS